MLFAMIAEDKPNGVEQRAANRPLHVAHLESLGDAIVFAGALLDEQNRPNGSLIVIEAVDLESARHALERDPFVTTGQFASFTVQGWKWAINNPTGRGER